MFPFTQREGQDDNVKSLQTDGLTDGRRPQAIRNAHLILQLRWAKNEVEFFFLIYEIMFGMGTWSNMNYIYWDKVVRCKRLFQIDSNNLLCFYHKSYLKYVPNILDRICWQKVPYGYMLVTSYDSQSQVVIHLL